MSPSFKVSVTIDGVRQVAGVDVEAVGELVRYYKKCKGCKRPESVEVSIWLDEGRTITSTIAILPTYARADGPTHAHVEGVVRGCKVTARLATDIGHIHDGTVTPVAI